MKRIILAASAVGFLALGLVGCSHQYQPSAKDAMVVQTMTHDGRVVSRSDMRVYRKNPRHVFVYDGVRYRVKHHDNEYVYYRAY